MPTWRCSTVANRCGTNTRLERRLRIMTRAGVALAAVDGAGIVPYTWRSAEARTGAEGSKERVTK